MISRIPRPSPRAKFITLALAGAIATAVFPLHATAETVKPGATAGAIPAGTLSVTESRVLSREAARVVRNVADARSAIGQADVPTARAEPKNAQTLLHAIMDSMPSAKVRDRIWTARQHLQLDSVEDVRADLVPVRSDLEEISGFVAVDAAKTHIADADKKLKEGDKKGADQALKLASDSLVYTEVDLPVNETLAQIDAAIAALGNNNLVTANAALIVAENGMEYVSFSTTAPLGNARTHLWRATRDYAAHDYAATKADLKAASAWLNKAANSADKATRDEAARLKAELDNLATSVDSGADETASALSGLWAHSKALTDRESERASAAWSSTWTKSTTKLNLIDAKLHLAYAETAAFVHGTSGDVSGQLDQASTYLDQAAKDAASESNQKLQAAITASQASIAALKASLNDNSAAAKAHYQKVMSDLRQAISDL